MKFLKYRHRFASGTEKRFHFRLLDEEEGEYSEEDLESLLEEIKDRYSYSDKYRGIEYWIVDVDDISDEDKQRLVEKYSSAIKHRQQCIETYQQTMKRLTKFATW